MRPLPPSRGGPSPEYPSHAPVPVPCSREAYTHPSRTTSTPNSSSSSYSIWFLKQQRRPVIRPPYLHDDDRCQHDRSNHTRRTVITPKHVRDIWLRYAPDRLASFNQRLSHLDLVISTAPLCFGLRTSPQRQKPAFSTPVRSEYFRKNRCLGFRHKNCF